MKAEQRRRQSARMKKVNPMHRPEVIEKMRATLRQIGHKPRVRGGTGNGLTAPR